MGSPISEEVCEESDTVVVPKFFNEVFAELSQDSLLETPSEVNEGTGTSLQTQPIGVIDTQDESSSSSFTSKDFEFAHYDEDDKEEILPPLHVASYDKRGQQYFNPKIAILFDKERNGSSEGQGPQVKISSENNKSDEVEKSDGILSRLEANSPQQTRENRMKLLDAELVSMLSKYRIGDDLRYFASQVASILRCSMYRYLCEMPDHSTDFDVTISYMRMVHLMRQLEGFPQSFIMHFAESVLPDVTRDEFEESKILPNFGRLVSCLMTGPEEGLNMLVKFALYRPNAFHVFAFGFLAANPTFLSCKGTENETITKMIMAVLLKSNRFNYNPQSFHFFRKQLNVRQAFELDNTSYEQLVQSLISYTISTVQYEKPLDEFAVVLAMVVVHSDKNYFQTEFVSFMEQLFQDWKFSKISASTLGVFINSYGIAARCNLLTDDLLEKHINVLKSIKDAPNLSEILMASVNNALEIISGRKMLNFNSCLPPSVMTSNKRKNRDDDEPRKRQPIQPST